MKRKLTALFCCLLVLAAGCTAQKDTAGGVLATYAGGQVEYESYAPVVDVLRVSTRDGLRDQMAMGIFTARYLEELGHPVDQEQFLVDARANLMQMYVSGNAVEEYQAALGLSDEQVTALLIEGQYLYYTSQQLLELFNEQYAQDADAFTQAMDEFYAQSDSRLITKGQPAGVLATLDGEEIPLTAAQQDLLRYEDLLLLEDLSYQLVQIAAQNQDMANYALDSEGLEEYVQQDTQQLQEQQVFMDALSQTAYTLEQYLAANRPLCEFAFYQEGYRQALSDAYDALPDGEDKPASAELYIQQHLSGLLGEFSVSPPAQLLQAATPLPTL